MYTEELRLPELILAGFTIQEIDLLCNWHVQR